MKSINFKEANGNITDIDGTEIKAYKSGDRKGIIVLGYKLSIKERLYILFFGKLWFAQVTNNANVKPFRLTINKYQLIQKIPKKENTESKLKKT